MTFVATKEISQVFVIQKGTIEKYKNKWRETVKKYYEVILPEQKEREIEMLGIDGDIMWTIIEIYAQYIKYGNNHI